jgi:hypothetical protein
MTIEAKIVAHSSYPGCHDLITVQARYPRFIHSELMTHRAFSRSASSSRAVPIERHANLNGWTSYRSMIGE